MYTSEMVSNMIMCCYIESDIVTSDFAERFDCNIQGDYSTKQHTIFGARHMYICTCIYLHNLYTYLICFNSHRCIFGGFWPLAIFT